MLSRLIRLILFNLVHLIYTILEIICVLKQFVTFIWNCRNVSNTHIDDVLFIEKHSGTLKRIPKHVVYIVRNDDFSLIDFANLIIWSLTAGVSFISFYDKEGVLKSKENKLFYEVELRKKGVPGYIKWAHQPCLNGFVTSEKSNTINVNVFTEHDGRATIANFVRSISEKKCNFTRVNGDFSVDSIDLALREFYPSIPDPEVIIYDDKLCSTKGLLPWHIRLSEFIPINSFLRIKSQDYLEVLRKYSKCDQRFGT